MPGSVASRITGSWWQRLALVTWMLVGGQLVVSAVETTTTFVSTNVGLGIPLQPGGGATAITNSTVQVSGIQTGITRVTVSLYIPHRWPADVRITLVPPGGDVNNDGVVLLQANAVYSTLVPNALPPPATYPAGSFYSQSNRNSFATGIGIGNLPAERVSFSDGNPVINPANTAHVNNVTDQVHLKPNTYAPAQPLAAFNDMPPSQSNGTWRLYIEDVVDTVDDGTLVYWSMTITEPGPHIWTGGSTINDNWSTALNWQAGNVPTIGEPSSLLIFPSTAVGPTINDIGEIRVVTMNVAGGYGFTATGAESITLIANSTLSVSSGTAVNLNMPIALVEQPTITVTGAGGLNLLGNITNDGPAAGMILAAGTSPLTISGTNGYTGVTAISSGVIDITNDAALGGGGGAGTTVANGASLRVAAGLNLANETVSIQGTGVGGIGSLVFVGGTSILNGLTLVPSLPATINILAGAVTVNTVTAAVPAAVHTLSVTNAGTLDINGALPASTALNLNGGATTFGVVPQPNITTLSLSNGAGLNVGTFTTTISGNITVAASATGSTLAALGAGTINLGGSTRSLSVGNGAAANDLTVTATFEMGGLSLSGPGTTLWNSTSTGVDLSLNAGVLAGGGEVGNLTVGSAKLAMTGAFTVNNCTLGTNSWLAYTGQVITANGTVAINGGVLQPFSTGMVINNTTITPNTGAFRFYPRSTPAVVDYDTGLDVEMNSGGPTVSFAPTPTSYTAKEGDPPVVLALTSGGSVTVAITTAGGALTPGGDFVEIASVNLIVGANTVPLTINDDFIDEGTEIGELIIIPLSGCLVGAPSSATLTITDNDQSDAKSCGFGTGLTVFLLFGFGLLLHVRLRRP